MRNSRINVIGAAIEVHQELGPGYLEKIYEQAMALELKCRRLAFETQVPVAVYYKGEKICGQVLDMVIERRVIIELKSVEVILPIHDGSNPFLSKVNRLSSSTIDQLQGKVGKKWNQKICQDKKLLTRMKASRFLRSLR